jgi:hypothetical protein
MTLNYLITFPIPPFIVIHRTFTPIYRCPRPAALLASVSNRQPSDPKKVIKFYMNQLFKILYTYWMT